MFVYMNHWLTTVLHVTARPSELASFTASQMEHCREVVKLSGAKVE